VNSKTQPDHAGFALGQRREHRLRLIAQQGEAEHIHGAHGLGILDDIPSRKGPSSPTLWSSEKRPASGALQHLRLLQGDAQISVELVRLTECSQPTLAGVFSVIFVNTGIRYLLNVAGFSDIGKWPMPSMMIVSDPLIFCPVCSVISGVQAKS
jgi:hypothetical protein